MRSIEYCKDPSAAGCGAWVAEVANVWRTTGDVQATWGSVMGNLHSQNDMAPVAKTGHYNDPGTPPCHSCAQRFLLRHAV